MSILFQYQWLSVHVGIISVSVANGQSVHIGICKVTKMFEVEFMDLCIAEPTDSYSLSTEFVL